jgi:uncharacterized membrane protein YraQ (UPF0718 family)
MKPLTINRNAIKCFVIFSIFFFAADLTYKTVNNISYLNRENCILYRMLPKVGFLFFEYFIELFLIVVVGIFLAVLLEAYFVKYRRFYPTNTITAFFYASLLPVCACTTIPLISSMREKLTFRTIITFVVAAPLLSPYIIVLSFSVLGTTYGILRIVSSFLLAIVSGFVLEFFYSKEDLGEWIVFSTYNPHEGHPEKPDVYLKTYEVFKKILPYLIVAGVAGILIELAAPANFLKNHTISNNIIGVMLVVLAGIPVYLCHGAEVLFLRPLIHQGGLLLGTAMAFSLASTSICITSFVMLIKFMGRKLTIILLTNLIIVTLILGVLLNAVVPEISFPAK